MSTGITQEMIEAGIAAMGSDDDRPTAIKVADIYGAMIARSDAPEAWRIDALERHVLQLGIVINTIRSHLRSLPRSATANRIDEICADALGEPRTP